MQRPDTSSRKGWLPSGSEWSADCLLLPASAELTSAEELLHLRWLPSQGSQPQVTEQLKSCNSLTTLARWAMLSTELVSEFPTSVDEISTTNDDSDFLLWSVSPPLFILPSLHSHWSSTNISHCKLHFGICFERTQIWHSLTYSVRNIWVLSNKHNLKQLKQTWGLLEGCLWYLTEESNDQGVNKVEVNMHRKTRTRFGDSIRTVLDFASIAASFFSLQTMLLHVEGHIATKSTHIYILKLQLLKLYRQTRQSQCSRIFLMEKKIKHALRPLL